MSTAASGGAVGMQVRGAVSAAGEVGAGHAGGMHLGRAIYDDYISLKDHKNKTFPSVTIYSLMWHTVEDQILQHWSEHVLSANPKPAHISWHFDGMIISRTAMVNIQQYCVSCEKCNRRKDSFQGENRGAASERILSLACRTTRNQFRLRKLCQKNAFAQAAFRVPFGICLHFIELLSRPRCRTMAWQRNVEATSSGSSSYRSVTALYKPDLNAALGLPPDDVGSFMLHYQGDGCPHCVPVQFSHGKDSAMVLDGRNGFKVSTAVFQEAVASAVDRSTIVSYWQRQPRGKPGPEATCLLDMKAGSSDMIAGAASDDSEDDVAGDVRGRISSKFSLDEEDNPVVSDGIRTLLSKEAKAVLQKLADKGKSS